MARTKTAPKTAAPAPKTRRGRKSATDMAGIAPPAVSTLAVIPTAASKLREQEDAIATKYGLEVKKGSLRYDEVLRKKVFTFFCSMCQKPREIATQDAFQVRCCTDPACRKAFKKANQ